MKKTLLLLLCWSAMGAVMASESLSETELTVIRSLAASDIRTLAEGGQSFFLPKNADGTAALHTTLQAIQQASASYKVMTTSTLDGKLVIFKGTVERATKTPDGHPMLVVSAQGASKPVDALLSPKLPGLTVKEPFKKGRTVSLLCRISYSTKGDLRFDDCQLTADLAGRAWDRVNTALDHFKDGSTGDTEMDHLVEMAVAISVLMPKEQVNQSKNVDAVRDLYLNALRQYDVEKTWEDPRVMARLRELKIRKD